MRFFRWALIVLFVACYVTAYVQRTAHVGSGYVIALLIAARLVWGFVRSHRTQLASFARGPSTVLPDVGGMLRGVQSKRL